MKKNKAFVPDFYNGFNQRFCCSILGSLKAKSFVPFVVLLLVLVSTPYAISGTDLGSTNSKIPAEYGQVIYQHNEESQNQLFIIGISHRDSLTRVNGDNTSRVQAEVYKIGEWLIRNKGLELLLPEGFFKERAEEREADIKAGFEKRNDRLKPLGLKELEKKLSDDSIFLNAEMLLRRNYPLSMEQVEDKALYNAVSSGIQKLVNNRYKVSDYHFLKSELDYLQDRRTASMLQKIPEIIQDEFRQGTIKERKAFFTIGLSHIYNIIKYLDENRINICPPPATSVQSGDYITELNLVKEDFGVTIILPRTLADDQEILRITKLNEIVTDCRRQSFAGSSQISLP